MTQTKQHWRSVVRAWLDEALPDKFIRPPWLFPFFPLVVFAAFLVAAVAFFRRLVFAKQTTNPRRWRALLQSFSTDAQMPSGWRRPKIVCVGNVLMGGSGKTPVVQYLLRRALEQPRPVALVTRGYGRPKAHKQHKSVGGLQEPEIFSGSQLLSLLQEGNYRQLGDEAAENAQLLLWHLKDQLGEKAGQERFAFFSLVFACNRLDGIWQWWKGLLQLPPASSKSKMFPLLLLDDGLQNFSFVPDVSLCVWQKDLLPLAPPFAFPLGPYREGFGNVLHLRRSFQFNVWSRFADTQQTSAVAQVKDFVACNPKIFSEDSPTGEKLTSHIFVLYQQVWLFPCSQPTPEHLLALANALLLGDLRIVCGLGQPALFYASCAQTLASCFTQLISCRADFSSLCEQFALLEVLKKQQSFLLDDHGLPSAAQLATLSNQSSQNLLLMSSKDYFRMSHYQWLRQALIKQRLFVLGLNVSFCNGQGEPRSFEEDFL